MDEFNIGDRVDVTITGATIKRVGREQGWLDLGRGVGSVHPNADGVTVTHGAPDARLGDVYRDRHRDLWFVRDEDEMVCVTGTEMSPAEAHKMFGPMTRVSRIADAEAA